MLRRILFFVLLLTFLPNSIARGSEGTFEFKRISPYAVSAGGTISWSLDFEGKSGYLPGGISLFIVGPNEEHFNSSWQFQDGGLGQKTKLERQTLTLQTGKKVSSGEYKIKGVIVFASCRNCENGNPGSITYVYRTDPRLLYQYGPNIKTLDLSAADFRIDGGEFAKSAIPRIESVTFSDSVISPGEKVKVTINTSTPGHIWKWVVDLRSPSGRRFSWIGFNDNDQWNNTTKAEYKRNGELFSITFEIPIDEDFSPGNYSISRLILDWFLDGPPNFKSNNRDNTALWGGSYDLISDQDGLRLNGSVWASEYSKYEINKLNLTILDAGQGDLRSPIWTRIEWVKPEAKAGEVSYLEIDVDAFRFQISSIVVGNFINEIDGKLENFYTYESELVGSAQQYAKSNWVKKGTFRVPIYFPRAVAAGTYRISYLQVTSSKCLNGQDQKCNNSENSRINTIYSNVLSDGSQPWLGYVDPASKKLKISGIAEVPPPTLSFTNITSESFAFTEQKPYEITCDYNSNIGGILRPVDEKSTQLFKVLELEPFTDVKINYLCKARDGASSNGSFTVKTEKPTPPAPPILALKEAKQYKLDLAFVPREGFSYQATSNRGTLKINNGIINISNLKPGEEVLVTTTITDPYDQSSTSKPQLFKTALPSPPREPVLTLLDATKKKLTFFLFPELGITYEFKPSRGVASFVATTLTVNKFKGTTPIQVTAVARDEFGQLSKHITKKIQIPKK